MAVKLVVHSFAMGDVEDPDLYAAEPLWEWQQTELGKWVMENAIETPEWHRSIDDTSYGYRYNIVAVLDDKDATWFKLKYDYIK
jgi:hypothetical protein